MSEQPEFFVGDAVNVRKGVDDPDIEYVNQEGGWWDDVSLAGWVGIISDIEELPNGKEMLTIEWDSHTLHNVPERWKRFCRQELFLDENTIGFMVLADADVKPAEPRDTAAQRRQARRELYAELQCEDMRAELREFLGIDEATDDRGEVAWSTHQLRAPLIAHATRGPDVRRGLDELDRLCATHYLDWHHGTRWSDGERQGDDDTGRLLRELRRKGAGTLVVRAAWDGLDISGDDVRLVREVVVELTPRDCVAL
jgi:hypothetical protein